MAYALIPEGFELKKVTKLQQQAVDEYFGRQRRGTYISELLSNPTIPPILGAIIGLASAPTILGLIFDALTKQDNGNGNGFKPPTKVEYAEFTKDFIEGFLEIATPEGAGIFKGEAADFWDKYVTK
jgi:hypothetical protein